MEKVFSKVEELTGSVKDYINTRVEAAKLNMAAKTSMLAANIIAAAGVAAVLLFSLLMLRTALAFALGEWLHKMWLGFVIVAVLYLVLGMILWAARRKLIQLPVMNALLGQLFTNTENDEED